MPLDPNALGAESPQFEHRYDWQSLALYALSVGATPEEERCLLLGKSGLTQVLPTFPVVPALPAVQWLQRRLGCDQRDILHGGQKVWLHRPLEVEGSLRTRGRIVGIYDLRRMAQTVIRTRTSDQDNHLIAETEWNILHKNEGNFDGDPPPRQKVHRAPAGEPGRSVLLQTSLSQAALYRL